ncbi:MAG: RNA polymerase sigma factor [Planctomycetes bacterium]|nr:RNA polymerase sigma factor [Planctomycetota bacterium]
MPQPSGSDERPFADRLAAALPELRAYASRLVRGIEREELVQEVAARALRSAESHDPRRPLAPWLRRTALRAWIDAHERGAREPASVPDPQVAVESDELRAVEMHEEVEHWLGRLAPAERDVLERFHRKGQSLREISAALEMPEGTIKSHLHRARRRLAALREVEDED